MSGAVTVGAVAAILAATLLLGLSLAIWPPMWAAAAMTPVLAFVEARRGLRRWRGMRRAHRWG